MILNQGLYRGSLTEQNSYQICAFKKTFECEIDPDICSLVITYAFGVLVSIYHTKTNLIINDYSQVLSLCFAHVFIIAMRNFENGSNC